MERRYWDINDVRRDAKGHWFSPGAMRFFKSRVSADVWETLNNVYFVSSERGPSGVRLFSVRVFSKTDKSVNTFGEFQGYRTLKSAKSAAKRAAEAE